MFYRDLDSYPVPIYSWFSPGGVHTVISSLTFSLLDLSLRISRTYFSLPVCWWLLGRVIIRYRTCTWRWEGLIIADYNRQFITWNRRRSRNRLKCHVLQFHNIIVVTDCSEWHRLSLSLVAVMNQPTSVARSAATWIHPFIGSVYELDLVGHYNSESEIYLFRMPRYLRWLTWLEDTKESRNYTQGQYWVGGRHGKGCGKEWWVCSLLWVRQPALETRPKKGTSRCRQILGSFRKK